jgi:hypothetical protein
MFITVEYDVHAPSIPEIRAKAVAKWHEISGQESNLPYDTSIAISEDSDSGETTWVARVSVSTTVDSGSSTMAIPEPVTATNANS